MNKVLCLLGPTASGKTPLALQLADHFPCDLISVDSAMVYRGLDIGTAKPDAETLKRYPHALIDICEPTKVYSAAQFREDAQHCIEQALARARLPVLVGGTMLYHRVLQQGIAALPPANRAIREALQKKAETVGWEVLYQELREIDPEAAERIHPNDPQRLLRALEVYQISGKSLSWHWQQQAAASLPYTFINIGLWVDRPLLRERIAQRADAMLAQGFVDEVRQLFVQPGMHAELPAMKSVGYQQVWQYLEKKINHEQMLEQVIHKTRQLAKRQVTWLRRWPGLQWVNPSEADCLKEIIQIILA